MSGSVRDNSFNSLSIHANSTELQKIAIQLFFNSIELRGIIQNSRELESELNYNFFQLRWIEK